MTNQPIDQLTNYKYLALSRAVAPSITRCELTHLARSPIDVARAVIEHETYEQALVAAGCRIERLPPTPELPDSVFVEDTAVVLDQTAVIARPGAESRRRETLSAAEALGRYRRLTFIAAPGTLDGGDVLRIGATLFVGATPRTNAAGIEQLTVLAGAEGLTVRPIGVRGCLHLKSAVTLAGASPATVVLNPAWVDRSLFDAYRVIEVDPSEPFAGNVLEVGGRTLCAAEFPRTRERLERAGIDTVAVPAGELAKAEGGLTCGSLIVPLA